MDASENPLTTNKMLNDVEAGERDIVLISTYLILAGLIFTQRFAFVIGGFPFQVCFIVAWGAILWMLSCNAASIDINRLVLYLIMVATMSGLFLINGGQGTVTSLGLLFVIYLGFVFRMEISRHRYKAILNAYQTLLVIVAVAGLLQFALQFFISHPALFSFYDVLPDSMLMPGYNTAIPIRYGVDIYKSNGLFLLEPSTFSQFLAIAVIIELLYFERAARLVLFFAAMVFSYSGTGLLLLALFIPIVLLAKKKRGYMLLLLFVGIVLFAFRSELDLDVYINRSQEIHSENSSASHRFVGPFYLIDQFIMNDVASFFMGTGAGSIENYTAKADRGSHDPAWAKLLLEYGFIGFVVFMSFLIYAMFSNTHSVILSSVFLIKYLFLGGTLLNQMGNMLAVILVVLPVKRTESVAQIAKLKAKSRLKKRQTNKKDSMVRAGRL